MIEETKPDNRRQTAKPPYAWRVLIIYSLFGPPLGIVSLILFLTVEFHVVASEPLPPSNQFFRNMPEFFLASYLVGGIPAILTGLLAMLLRLKRNLPGIAAVTAAGALLSVICDAVMFGMSGSAVDWIFLVLGCGAAAAFVLSVFLPKPAK
ncbi:hypothetical protein [Eikenella corrodens]|uniref:hypothetical protein n=1 Tax=Eikenella corrodens TaxID=539 RepID=UPI00241C6032|nr:hypothetical protein [Eikenella corrodens]